VLQSSMACEVYSPLAADAYALYVLLLKGPLTTKVRRKKFSFSSDWLLFAWLDDARVSLGLSLIAPRRTWTGPPTSPLRSEGKKFSNSSDWLLMFASLDDVRVSPARLYVASSLT
jgi:hypothetical protein